MHSLSKFWGNFEQVIFMNVKLILDIKNAPGKCARPGHGRVVVGLISSGVFVLSQLTGEDRTPDSVKTIANRRKHSVIVVNTTYIKHHTYMLYS